MHLAIIEFQYFVSDKGKQKFVASLSSKEYSEIQREEIQRSGRSAESEERRVVQEEEKGFT